MLLSCWERKFELQRYLKNIQFPLDDNSDPSLRRQHSPPPQFVLRLASVADFLRPVRLFFLFFNQGGLVPGRLSWTLTVSTLTSNGKQLGSTQYCSDNLDWNTRLEYLLTCFNTSVNSVACREPSVQFTQYAPDIEWPMLKDTKIAICAEHKRFENFT